MIQVTPKEVRLLSAAQKNLVHQWRPPDGLQINVAAGNPSQVPTLLAMDLFKAFTETYFPSEHSLCPWAEPKSLYVTTAVSNSSVSDKQSQCF